MAKKEIPEDEGVSQEWLASYADAMTLLLAFFIMMFAFALIDEGKFFDFKVGVVAALGVPDPLTDNTDSILEKGSGITPEVGLTPLRPSDAQKLSAEELIQSLSEAGVVTEENAEDLRKLIELKVSEAGADQFVEVGVDERGVFIRFKERVLFASGQADLDDDGLIVLAVVTGLLTDIDNYLEVEGHTDSQPTNGGAWPSNWELSGVRAAGVVRYMIDPGGVPTARLAALGLADTKPIGDNNTLEGRQENRRVEVVVRLPEVDDPLLDEVSPAEDLLSDEPVDVDGETAIDGDPVADDDPTEDGQPGTDIDPGRDIDPETGIDPIGDPIGLPTTPETDG